MTLNRFRPILAAAFMATLITTTQTASAEPPPDSARYVKADAVNVRSGPGTSNVVIEVVILGTEVRIYATSGNWSRISPPGEREKWIYTPLLQKEKPPVKQKAKKIKDEHQAKPDQKDHAPSDKESPKGGQDKPDDHGQQGPEQKGKPNQQDQPGTPR